MSARLPSHTNDGKVIHVNANNGNGRWRHEKIEKYDRTHLSSQNNEGPMEGESRVNERELAERGEDDRNLAFNSSCESLSPSLTP